MRSSTIQFRLAVFQKADGQLSKTIVLGDDGLPVSDGSACNMAVGNACNVSVAGLSELAEIIGDMSNEQALALGAIFDRDDDEVVNVVTNARLSGSDDEIARTKKFLGFEKGQPGFLLIDYDQKGMPDGVRKRIDEAGGVWELISSILPGLTGAGHLSRLSTSAGLSNSKTGDEYPESGGLHLYVAVQYASDISRATKALHKRLFLAGCGWIRLGKTGQMLERSIVDQSVGSPERLVFEGAPVLVPPLEQSAEARKPIVVEGEVVNTRLAIPDLTSMEIAHLDAILSQQKAQLEPEARKLRKKADKRLAKKLARKTGVPIAEAERQIARRHHGDLLPLYPLHFDDPELGEASVGDVLNNPDLFVDMTLADPLEGISYGRNKAKVFRRSDGALIIHSFAHGGGLYYLKHDYGLLLERIEAMSDETDITDIRDFVDAVTLAFLELGQLDLLVTQVKAYTEINKGVIRERIKARQTERDNFARRHVENEEQGDTRARFPLPLHGGELTPVLAQVDAVLSAVDLPVPPFRAVDGHMARVVERPITGLFTLASDASEGDPMPAPAQLSIARAEDAEVTMVIEEHVRFVDHRQRNARLQLPFIRAYASWDRSSLPRVSGISELPLVLPDRTLRARCGLDRELGLIMAIPQPLLDALNKTEEVSLGQAREDYKWLCDNWFVDVDTDNEGKAIIIALALTLIERHLLPERPAFFVTAAQRGSGKTTILNMVSAAVTGQLAAATSWSFDDEERRKGLFSYLREAASMVVYDNIPRGAKVSCPTIERALTSPKLADRVLGESRTETVPTATILAFTGNNIGPKGDLASRSLVASLFADRPDPENREFQHDDPIGWTKAHRIEILRRLFNILRCKREQLEIAKTRFKHWYRLVGHPVELVADVDFEDIFRANDAMDEELQGAIEFFAMMLRFLARDGQMLREFTAAEVAKLLEDKRFGYVNSLPSNDPEKPDPVDLKSALEEASGRPFTGGNVNSRRVGIKLKSIAGRPVEVDGVLFHLVVVENHEGNRYKIEPLD